MMPSRETKIDLIAEMIDYRANSIMKLADWGAFYDY